MAEHNTGLFLRGHVPADEIARLLWAAPGLTPQTFTGEEAVRVGHGEREGMPFTHVALRLFEVGGVRLIEELDVPGPDDVEVYLGRALSRLAGVAVYLLFEDEAGYGGHALFRDGALVSRQVVDGNGRDPVQRDLEREWEVEVDESHWVYPLMGDLLEAGGRAVWGDGVRSDHDLAPLIEAAAARPVEPEAPERSAESPPEQPEKTGRRGRLRGLVRRLARR